MVVVLNMLMFESMDIDVILFDLYNNFMEITEDNEIDVANGTVHNGPSIASRNSEQQTDTAARANLQAR